MLTSDEIMRQSTLIFRDLLDNEDIILKPETTADDIEEWDSLSHIQLVVAVEKHFKIRFTAAEITGYRNVGEMCAGIENKLMKYA